MDTYYNVEIQMAGTNKMTEQLAGQIASDLGAIRKDVDELGKYNAVIFFRSEIKPTEMRRRVRDILSAYKNQLHYIDVIYRFEYEMTPDRFCFWSDKREQEYEGRIIFKEDE